MPEADRNVLCFSDHYSTLTLRNESSDPFSMYSTTIITGRPADTETQHTLLISPNSAPGLLQVSIVDQNRMTHKPSSMTHETMHMKPVCTFCATSGVRFVSKCTVIVFLFTETKQIMFCLVM